MSASRVGRASLKKAQRSVPGLQRMGNKVSPAESPGKSQLPKRANPLLVNPPASASRPNHGVSPRIMTLLGIGILSMSTYCGYLYTSYRREATQAQFLKVPQDVSDRYNHTAGTFDADVALSEKVMRMGRKRHDLIQMARGDVLEVSCGTGRNLQFYDMGLVRGCRFVTFVDLSPQMVDITRQKFEELYPRLLQKAAFRVQDAGAVTPSTTTATSTKDHFDTVVQTMGLCSMPDPVGTLRHLGSITEPQQGRILLLEHGRSHYDWLNTVLDNLAPAHADRHGCWWNRDIGKIVRESGLEVVEEKRWHFGTTWRYVLRPKRD